jgi:alpha-amylase
MGELRLDMDKGEPRVLYPEALMKGSGLCGFQEAKVSYLDFVNKSYTPPTTKDEASTGALGTRVDGGSWLALAALLLGLVALGI